MYRIIGVDAGCTESAAACIDVSVSPPAILWHTQLRNDEMMKKLKAEHAEVVAFETILSYGGAGQEVLDTTYWVGRLWTACEMTGKFTVGFTRLSTRRLLFGKAVGGDKEFRRYVIDVYGGDEKKVIGLKKSPGPLYGVVSHTWQALGTAMAAYNALKLDNPEQYYWDPFYTSSDLFMEKRAERAKERKKKEERTLAKGQTKGFLADKAKEMFNNTNTEKDGKSKSKKRSKVRRGSSPDSDRNGKR